VKPTRTEAEAQARRFLWEAIQSDLRLVSSFESLLRSVSGTLAGGEISDSHGVAHGKIAGRLADDIRVFRWALTSGYAFQAMSLGASIQELALMALYIGANDERAKRWLKWDKPERLPWKRAEVLQAVAVDKEFYKTTYMLLCAAKHANPRSVLRDNASVTPLAHIFDTDPDFTPRRPPQARFILWITLRPVFEGALWTLVDHQLLDEHQREKLASVGNRWLTFHQEMVKKTKGNG